MRGTVAVVAAYAAAAASVSLFWAATLAVFPMPLPRAVIFAPWPVVWFGPGLLALIAGLPGFAVTRLLLWRSGARSAWAFFGAGVFTGLLAALVLTVPGHLSVLYQYGIAIKAAVIGGGAALIYRWVEQRLAGRVLARRQEMADFPGGGR